MKYHLENNSKLIDFSKIKNILNIFKKKNDDKKKEDEGVIYSRTEDYFVYDNNTNKRYASLYLRADERKIEINREYQNLLDFYAENTSFWIGIFEFLNIFFTKIIFF